MQSSENGKERVTSRTLISYCVNRNSREIRRECPRYSLALLLTFLTGSAKGNDGTHR